MSAAQRSEMRRVALGGVPAHYGLPFAGHWPSWPNISSLRGWSTTSAMTASAFLLRKEGEPQVSEHLRVESRRTRMRSDRGTGSWPCMT